MTALHGGPDAQGVPRWDFSTNANACGPCPVALQAVQQADSRYYPDPGYTALRAQLAAHHGVAVDRIVLAGSASEFISRVSAAVAVLATTAAEATVWVPELAYGDYQRAAAAWGLARVAEPSQARLVWLCEPSSPIGGAQGHAQGFGMHEPHTVVVLDRAYEPLRLSGRSSFSDAALSGVWQMWSPNKALGMTGVRGAYVVAPRNALTLVGQLNAMAPSWPLGAHAVAMLGAWARPEVQQWVAGCKPRLAEWKAEQQRVLVQLGWRCLPSDANYFCAQSPEALDVLALRQLGIKLRETTSLGLVNHWRLSAQPPETQRALQAALQASAGIQVTCGLAMNTEVNT